MLVCREASKKLSLLVDPINQGLAEGPNPPFTNSGPLKLTIFFANFPYLSCVLHQLCSFLLGSPRQVLLHIYADLLQQLCLSKRSFVLLTEILVDFSVEQEMLREA